MLIKKTERDWPNVKFSITKVNEYSRLVNRVEISTNVRLFDFERQKYYKTIVGRVVLLAIDASPEFVSDLYNMFIIDAHRMLATGKVIKDPDSGSEFFLEDPCQLSEEERLKQIYRC